MAGLNRVLIANRGEIVLRIAGTARAMGIGTVAVYSDADVASPHVEACDRAIWIGGAPATDSYLVGERIIEAARVAGADAIHPGYGFLAENADFAQSCADAGLIFIGPPPDVIRRMGDKRLAKAEARKAGVAVIPGPDSPESDDGPDGSDQSDAGLEAAARALGFPLMVKAAAGGGGHGLRRVEGAGELAAALSAARAEAQSSFGDDKLILEKLIAGARHVEIQILADDHGGVVHLGERDCSMQRRFQKVIEESPSPAVDGQLRRAMGEAACALARGVGYRGAGTIEFLLDGDGHFYFMEMNTRLQVEHPVTEMVTGLDLVAWQLRIAAGEPLDFDQDRIAIEGHAIEARLYAESPSQGFLPQSGTVAKWLACDAALARSDHGLRDGLQIGPHYDAMVAKIIAHGDTREQARGKLIAALGQTVLLGVTNNKALLLNLLRHEAFIDATAATDFIDAQGAGLTDNEVLAEPPAWALAAALMSTRIASPGGWRLTGEAPSWPLRLAQQGRPAAIETDVDVEACGDGFLVTLGDDDFLIDFDPPRPEAGHLRYRLDWAACRAAFAFAGATLYVDHDGACYAFRALSGEATDDRQRSENGVLTAPMAGRVVAVSLGPGDRVRAGDVVMVLEAMKMQHEITAGRDGTVGELSVGAGDQVSQGQTLAVIVEPIERQGE